MSEDEVQRFLTEVARTGKMAICVDDDRPPFSFVLLEDCQDIQDIAGPDLGLVR